MKLWFQRLVQIAGSPIVRASFLTRAQGVEKIPKQGPIIIAANHASNLDPLLIMACLPRMPYNLSKDTLFKPGPAGFLLRHIFCQIPVTFDGGSNELALREGMRVLDQGHALGVFPEGNRSPDGRLQKSSTGVALFAYLSGAPVYPVGISGTFEAWPRHRSVPSLLCRTRLTVGDPIAVTRDPGALDDVRRCRALTDDIMSAIGALIGEPYPRAKVPPRTPQSLMVSRPGQQL
jgi:1-acyl-sn-glycerol-3-phosphate acyltransferase